MFQSINVKDLSHTDTRGLYMFCIRKMLLIIIRIFSLLCFELKCISNPNNLYSAKISHATPSLAIHIQHICHEVFLESQHFVTEEERGKCNNAEWKEKPKKMRKRQHNDGNKSNKQ